jgi:dihydropteroate synthase
LILICREREIDLSRPAVMGVLNVTPDSFSDGGEYAEAGAAVERALAMVNEGADIIDVGGESTRPGAEPVAEAEELDRVLPVIEALRPRIGAVISIDTVKPAVMRAACAAGADLINDVKALQAEGALQTAAETGAAVCLMHMQGEPRTMQKNPIYGDVVAEVRDFLATRVAACEAAGIARERLIVDPGFGFGKTLDHNLMLLRRLPEIAALDLPVLVGLSRKSMFAKLLGELSAPARVPASVAAAAIAVLHGARVVRTHDVAATRQAVDVAWKIT